MRRVRDTEAAAASTVLSLASNSMVPSDASPWLDDRRRLGVVVSEITWRLGPVVHVIAMDDPGLVRGWWPPERNGLTISRWTDGSASLPAMPGPAVLEITLAPCAAYPAAAAHLRAAA
jgi:hypothetical protein